MSTRFTRTLCIMVLAIFLAFSLHRNVQHLNELPLVLFEPICTDSGYKRITDAHHRNFVRPTSDAFQERGETFAHMRGNRFRTMFESAIYRIIYMYQPEQIRLTWKIFLDDEKSYELTRAAVRSFVYVQTLEDQSLSKDIDTYLPGFSEGKLPCDKLRIMVTEGRLP